ncbi:MAG TPA: hypothetical protein VGE36_04565 [Roseateles sp.]
MTGIDIFNGAVYWAQKRAHYRQRANEGHQTLTRRQCLRRARQAEARIVDLSIKAEIQARREQDMGRAA